VTPVTRHLGLPPLVEVTSIASKFVVKKKKKKEESQTTESDVLKTRAGNPYCRGRRLSTVDLLVLTCLD
jgi:hypothetical protein